MNAIFDFFSNISKEFALFMVSMVPVVELRLAIPMGAALGMEWWKVYAICVIGNMLPVPFIILFVKHIFVWLKKIKIFYKPISAIERKIFEKSEKIDKYSFFGLAVFVAIPLPGTGAWTGAGIAAILDVGFKKAMLSILLGVLCAGAVMTLGSYGIVKFFQIF